MNIHSMLFNDAPPAKAAPAPAPDPSNFAHPADYSRAVVAHKAATAFSPETQDAAPDTTQDEVYQHLLKVTDFTSTDTYAALRRHLDPLASVPGLDEHMKFNIALKEAVAQNGFDPAQVDAAFARLVQALEDEAAKFLAHADDAVATGVAAKTEKAQELAEQITALQAQVAQLKADAFAAQQKVDAAKQRFQAALATRGQELTQERAKYAALVAA